MKKAIVTHFSIHVLLSLVTGFFAFLLTKNLFYFSLGFIFNIGLDLDHLIEYRMISGDKFNFKMFLSGRYFIGKECLFLIFHAWEYILLSFFLWILSKEIIFLIIFIGILTHMIFDQLSYKNNWLVYSLFFRFKNNFKKSLILPDNK